MDIPASERCAFVLAWARALCTTNYLWLKAMRAQGIYVPPIFASGVQYVDQVLGQDEWLDAKACLTRGFGACEDFAAWRVAELVLQGERARLDVDTSVAPDGTTLYHVVVLRGTGAREDPSKILGMP